ncbi:mediator of RNA polymerase II transcription subunit 26-like [Poeciliopsis prolifica]|uniref:mediator of RNA polymerase II transcription subunit 26-like n=1 Tax=Poeciliopsis prolifica TaxID=188132 RepID=UPI002413B84F|nr:mediator of RNA polymerase II transcription subunit 26-like [Poeciliopsis prolifica]
MSAATATPRVMRDRLLQAIDGQSNIRNMVVVVEVISSLEKYSITKEVLEETRLGKLINDIRKKTKNEDLAKRAKKLLRTWQKLIDPGQDGLVSKELTGACWSSKGSSYPCSSLPVLSKTGSELKARSDFNNCSPNSEPMSNRKRRCDKKEGQTKKPRVAHDDTKQQPSNGLGGNFKIPANTNAHQPSDRNTSKYLDNSKSNKVPVHAVKPHASASVYSNPPNMLMQQQVRWDKHQPRSPGCLLQHPESLKQEAVIKKTQTSGNPGVKAEESAQTLNVHINHSGSANLEFQSRTSSLDDETITNDAVKMKREKYRGKDYVVNLNGPITEDKSKPVRLKDRRITFDPLTGQIKRICPKESSEEQKVSELQLKPNQPIPPSPFQQTHWKEQSRSEIIQSYLTQQSNILSSSGAHNLFMSEVCKRADHQKRNTTETSILVSDHHVKELPGVSREISSEDLTRLQRRRWSGVNGCYDTKGNWYDWTECISLDLHGDESRLNILPYVCLD